MTTPPHQDVAALLRRQQSTTARLRAGLPALLEQLETLDEPALRELEDPIERTGDHPAER